MKGTKSWTITVLISILVLAGCFQNVASDTQIPRMTKEELKPLLGSPDVIVVDVRIGSGWKNSEWKIKGAVREDPEKGILPWADKYPKEKTLVFYCS